MNDSRFIIYYNKMLGQGTQGVVYEAYDNENNENICVKIISGSFNIDRELSILSELLKFKQNKNILNVYHIESQPTKNQIIIYMERCNYDLEQYMEELIDKKKWFSVEQIIDFINQIKDGYNYLISKKIIHRDLKPQNILVKLENDKPIYKLADFGVGKLLDSIGQLTQTRAGTPFYQAPEVLNKTEYDSRCDIYSFGLIIYQLAYESKHHWNVQSSLDIERFNENLKIHSFKCPENNNMPKELLQLIERMIVYDMKKRITWQQLFSEPLLINYEYVQDYTIVPINPIGQGKQGSVSECFKSNNRDKIYAAKRIFRSKDLSKDKYVESEFDIAQKLSQENCENIVKVYDILSKEKFYYIIMEKCDYDLRSYLYKTKTIFEEPDILNFLHQIVTGYEKIKKYNIIHRDLKPENILVNVDGKITYKLADFGIGVIKQNQQVSTFVGSPQYQAPEIGKGDYTDQCDVYSLGIITYELMYRDVPYKSPEQFFKIIQEKEFILPNNSRFQQNLKLIIQKMLIYDPKKRITWGGISKELKHFQEKSQIKREPKPITIISNINNQKIATQQNVKEEKTIKIKYSSQHQSVRENNSFQEIASNQHQIQHSLSQSESPKKRISIKKDIEMTISQKLTHLFDIIHTKFQLALQFYYQILDIKQFVTVGGAHTIQLIKSTVIRYSAFLIMNAQDLLNKWFDNLHVSLVSIVQQDELVDALDSIESQVKEKIKIDHKDIQIIYEDNLIELQKIIQGKKYEDRDVNEYFDYINEQNLQYQQTDKQNFVSEWTYFTIFYQKYLRELLIIDSNDLNHLKFVSYCEFFNTIERDFPFEKYTQFKASHIMIEEKNIDIIKNYLWNKRENII